MDVSVLREEFRTANIERLKELVNVYEIPKDSRWLDYELLNDALRCQRKDVAELLIQYGCRVNKSNCGQVFSTPLHFAVDLQDAKIIESLVKKGASLNIQLKNGDSPLHKACINKNEKILQIILSLIHENEFENLVNDNGLSHFHIACMAGQVNLVTSYFENAENKESVKNFVKLSSPNWPGYLPIHFAAEYNQTLIVKLLIDNESQLEVKESRGLTPLNLVCHTSFERVCDLIDAFLSQNENVNTNYLSDEEQQIIIEQISDHKAKIDTLKLLLMYGSDINSIDKFDKTPLVNACQKIDARIKRSNNYDAWLLEGVLKRFNLLRKELIKILIPYNADVNICFSEDETILHLLSDFNLNESEEELVNLLLEKGADINARNKYYETPLYIATRCENLNLVEIFLKNNADVNCTESLNQTTPLHLATTYKCKKIINMLLDYGADINAKQWDGKTPLHTLQLVIHHSDEETKEFYASVIDRFLKQKCDVNIRDQNGFTPLHVAALEKNIESALILLENGADINAEDLNGNTPLFYDHTDPILKNHIEKLLVINYYISSKNLSLYLRILMEDATKLKENDYLNNYKIELSNMKSIKIDNYTSLYNILFRDPNEMSYHIENDLLRNILESIDFKSNYPNYGYLLKLQFQKGTSRKIILDPAKESLKSLIKYHLPESCSEIIFKYLSNKDLENLINAEDVK